MVQRGPQLWCYSNILKRRKNYKIFSSGQIPDFGSVVASWNGISISYY